MSEKAARVLGVVLFSAAYCLVAVILVGAMQMGDCIDRAACAKSKDTTSVIMLVVAALVYAVVVSKWRFRSK